MAAGCWVLAADCRLALDCGLQLLVCRTACFSTSNAHALRRSLVLGVPPSSRPVLRAPMNHVVDLCLSLLPHQCCITCPANAVLLQAGVTNLAGWTPDERSMLNGILNATDAAEGPTPGGGDCIPWDEYQLLLEQAQQAQQGAAGNAKGSAALGAAAALPATFDWRDRGFVTSVSGGCGECV